MGKKTGTALEIVESPYFLSNILLLYYTKKSPPLSKVTQAIQQVTYSRKKLTADVSKVVLAAIVIFMSGKLLVHEAIFFSILLGIPASLIGLLIIAVGTNIPELVIAIRAVRQKNKGVAFGDYVGSAAFNTIILGVLVVMNGQFMIDRSEFLLISWFLVSGLFFFYLFSRSRYDISRSEGIALSLVYVAFVIVQLLSVAGMPNAH